MERKVKIAIAEDHPVMLEALCRIIEEDGFFEVIVKAQNGRDLLESLDELHVDITLLDIEMPVMDGEKALAKILNRYPESKIVVFSVHDEYEIKTEFIKKGARAFVSKSETEGILMETLHLVHKHGYAIPENTTKKFLAAHVIKSSLGNQQAELTSRETEILILLCRGMSNKNIASHLNISRHTVHAHRRKILSKTNTHNISGLMHYALNKGLYKDA